MDNSQKSRHIIRLKTDFPINLLGQGVPQHLSAGSRVCLTKVWSGLSDRRLRSHDFLPKLAQD
jgi:hypothetical protein